MSDPILLSNNKEMVKVYPTMNQRNNRLHLESDEFGGNSVMQSLGPSSTDETFVDGKSSIKLTYPKSVFFIFFAIGAERFSYYGMRTILSIYLKEMLMLKYDYDTESAEDTASIIFHCFTFLAFITALLGAVLADSCIGKYRTIFYLSVIYVLGHLLGALGAVPNSSEGIKGTPELPFAILSLILLAIGVGGIKPCLVSFGADQFTLPEQKEEMESYFGIFYFCINVGATVSIAATPSLSVFECYGETTCYSLAFMVPGILMASALISFLLGSHFYRRNTPSRNVIKDLLSCVWIGLSSKIFSKNENVKSPTNHWLDPAIPKYGSQFVSEVKAVLSASFLFTLYPPFWALFDQKASKWTFQASLMNGQCFETFQILPDQVSMINSILVLILIPLFDRFIYPGLGKFGILKTPLQKIVTGGIFMALAFVAAAILETQIQKSFPESLMDGEARLSLVNTLPCDLNITLNSYQDSAGTVNSLLLKANSSIAFEKGKPFEANVLNPLESGNTYSISASINNTHSICNLNSDKIFDSENFTIESKKSLTIFFHEDLSNVEEDSWEAEIGIFVSKEFDDLDKSSHGYPKVRVIHVLSEEMLPTSAKFVFILKNDEEIIHEILVNSTKGETKSFEMPLIGSIKVNFSCGDFIWSHQLYLNTGACYNIFFKTKLHTTDLSKNSIQIFVDNFVPPNDVHMMWQLPQYILLTMGEIMFSITSLAFAFTQAPQSMKAALLSLYLMTNGFGNLIDILVMVSVSKYIDNQQYEFLLFALLMLLTMFILAIVSKKYVYKEYQNVEK